MAIAISEPTPAVLTTTDTTTLATASYTPTANSIQVFIVFAKGSVDAAPTLSDAEIGNWTLKYVSALWPDGSSHGAYVFYRKVGGSPVAITPTFTTTDSWSGCGIVTFEIVPDVVVSGDPIRQVAFRTDVQANGSSANPGVTFASAVLTDNGYVMGISNNQNSTTQFTAPSGWTETRELGVAANNTGQGGFYRAGGETGTTFNVTLGQTTFAALGVEIWNDEPPSGTTYMQSIDGSIGLSGEPAIDVSVDSLAGTTSPAGEFARQTQRTVTGVIAAAGAFSNLLVPGGGSYNYDKIQSLLLSGTFSVVRFSSSSGGAHDQVMARRIVRR